MRLWRYPLHKLGVLTGHGIEGAPDIKTFAWGFVLNLSEDSGVMVALVRKESEPTPDPPAVDDGRADG